MVSPCCLRISVKNHPLLSVPLGIFWTSNTSPPSGILEFSEPQTCPLPPAPSILHWRVSISAWRTSSSWEEELPWTNSAPLDICVKVWLLATVEVPSQALTAPMLDGVESEGWRKWPHFVVLQSQNHWCWKRLWRSWNPTVTQGFGKKRKESLREMCCCHWIGLFQLCWRKLGCHGVTNDWKYEVQGHVLRKQEKFLLHFGGFQDIISLDKSWMLLLIYGSVTESKGRQTQH